MPTPAAKTAVEPSAMKCAKPPPPPEAAKAPAVSAKKLSPETHLDPDHGPIPIPIHPSPSLRRPPAAGPSWPSRVAVQGYP